MLLGAAVFLVFASLGSAQVAPGDEDDRCYGQVVDTYPPNKMILMSSNHYLTLLGSDGVWDQMDLDDHNTDSTFNPTFFRQNAGGLCRWSVMSCGWRSSDRNFWQDNYLFTQFISKAAPSNTNHNVRVVVDIQYTLSSCRERLGCNPKFELLKFETSGPQPREVYTDVTNYQSIRIRTGSSAASQRLVENIEIPANIEGLYLAVRDNRSCIQVAKMEVYRYQCNSKQEGLVIFPETAAPAESDMTITAQCMPNSSPVVRGDMDMTCDSDGNWRGSGRCKCDPGYKRVSGQSGESCVACPAGTYRSDSDPENMCLGCPGNTETDEKGAPECECQSGYFRNIEGLRDTCPINQTAEDFSDDCTQPPSEPRNLAMTGSTANTLTVTWGAPANDGGRSDTYYRVHFSDPDRVGVLLEANCSLQCLTNTSCTIEGLRPATDYVVQVSAHNGVSDQDENGALARLSDVTLTTDPAPPSAPQRPLAFCQVVVWEEPEFPNGAITQYIIKYFESGNEVSRTVSGDRNSFVLPSDLPSGTVIRIYAVNVAGTGPFITATIPSGCGVAEPEGPLSCPPYVITNTVTVTRPPVTATVTRVSTSTVSTTVTSTRTTSTPCPTPPSFAPITTANTVSLPCPSWPSPTPSVPTTVIRTATVTSTTTRTTSTPCPTPPPSSSPITTTNTVSRPGAVEEITVMGPCSFAWRSPADNGGERPGYAIRFFDGATYGESSFKMIFRYFEDPDKMFITLEDCPTDRPIYADIRAKNSGGVSDFSSRVQVSDPNSQSSCPACNSCCGTCPTSQSCPICLPPTICPICSPPVICPTCPTVLPPPPCPTVTCPECPTPTECTPRDCSTDSSPETMTPETTTEAVTLAATVSTPTLPPCFDKSRPSDISGLRIVGCVLHWDLATVDGCSDDGITYRIRLFTGSSYRATPASGRTIVSSHTNSLSLSRSDIPSTRPINAMVKARRGNAVFSLNWSTSIAISARC